MEIPPLDIKVTRCVLSGQMYDLFSMDQYQKQHEYLGPTCAVSTQYNGSNIILPIRGRENPNPNNPGIYDAGPVDFIVYPNDENIGDFIPDEIVDMSTTTPMKEKLEKSEVIARLDEPWITSPDNITTFSITEDDRPEMVCLKTALNRKNIDIDKYGPRFGVNFPNDKRQLKNTSATLNIIKRFCQYMDMEALITLRDKNPNVPNPIGGEVTVSLTEVELDDEETE